MQRPPLVFVGACLRHPERWWRAYVTVEVFVDIGYIAVVECIFGSARWLKNKRTGRLPRAPLTFWT